MKQHRLWYSLISLLLMLSILGAAGCISAAAAPEGEPPAQQEGAVDEANDNGAQSQPEAPEQDQANDGQQAQEQQEQPQEQQEQPQQEQPQDDQNEWYDYIYGYSEEGDSAYSKPEHLDELPQVASENVPQATAVAIPTVAVSDASLFSGIVMWLCIALGIAVVVGVLVSKRTRRHG